MVKGWRLAHPDCDSHGRTHTHLHAVPIRVSAMANEPSNQGSQDRENGDGFGLDSHRDPHRLALAELHRRGAAPSPQRLRDAALAKRKTRPRLREGLPQPWQRVLPTLSQCRLTQAARTSPRSETANCWNSPTGSSDNRNLAVVVLRIEAPQRLKVIIRSPAGGGNMRGGRVRERWASVAIRCSMLACGR